MLEADLLIEDGLIRQLGQQLAGSFDEEIDAAGKLILPGGVDVHTHFNLHTGKAVARDDFYRGTVAAACGGTTSIVDHMGFGPAGCELRHQLKVYHEYAKDNAVVDYSFHGVLQHLNEDILQQMEDMIYEEGISSFKLYMTYDYRLAEADILRLMRALKLQGGLLTVHAENHEIITYLNELFHRLNKTSPIYHALSRPDYCEGDAVHRLLAMAAEAGDTPVYIVHLTTELALEHIAGAQSAGRSVYAETCPQYLLLDQEKYLESSEEALKYILSPPLREGQNCEALWKGIRQGNIQVVATDHCPFNFVEDKQKGREDYSQCPNGLPGVEERLPLMFSEGVMKGRITLPKLVEVCCTNPAKLFGLYPKKGAILPGADADLVLIDPSLELTLTRGMLHSNVDYTAYEGWQLQGYPIMTLSRGEIIALDQEFIGSKGRGQFLKRKAFEGLI